MYAFIKKLIPIGRVLEIQNHQRKYINKFNDNL
ncbi:DUF735 family protein [Borrelia miyamotoi]